MTNVSDFGFDDDLHDICAVVCLTFQNMLKGSGGLKNLKIISRKLNNLKEKSLCW